MQHAHTITTTTIDRWLLPHIHSILAYADSDSTFGLTLATWLDEENWAITPSPAMSPSPYLQPVNHTQAEDTLDWLMHELATHPEARIARSAMVTWASNYEAPQDLIWGIAMTDTFGPTITGMTNKKKKRAKLQIVIDQDWQASQKPADLAEATHDISQQLIALELRKAGGKIDSLHPNTAEWCMAAAGTKIYSTDRANIQTIYTTALNDQLHHLTHETEDGIKMIAISPHVQDTVVTELVTEEN